MGCTSGGVRTKSSSGATKMLHFRTLDWGMDALRQLVVQLEFVESKGDAPFARSLSYAGYVGVLTGVRRGLSMSLNFRPTHNGTSLFERFRFYAFQIMVILGRRPSISSILRHTLLTPTTTSLQTIASGLPSVPSTAAYLIFSDGEQTLVMEKDHVSATLMYRKDFIVATNHDRGDEGLEDNTAPVNSSPVTRSIIGEVDAFREESVARKRCIRLDWQEAVELATGVLPPGQGAPGDADLNFSADQADVVTWLEEWPITNECTHYATILDPKEGTVNWLKRFLDPVESSDGSFTVSSEGLDSE
ncbi:hypothetical protein FIBSPDRAFT_856640 [Athelia psychrophila]|uniref:ceramidase n=1 Tax=Athelia psychrophila TaxID=1759441 RepID=A0A166NBI4_9AGAM|nr:hypothetical protein FIBSPDRAFT_856640 [Fibularhizoctonia sp. CBS 109695]